MKYLKSRNRIDIFLSILVIIVVALVFIVLFQDLFAVGELSIPTLSIITVFILMDVGYNVSTYIRLKKTISS